MAVTTRAEIRKPDPSEAASIAAAVGNGVDDIDKCVIPVYTSATQRDASGTPTIGNLCYMNGDAPNNLGNALQVWDGGKWKIITPPLFARKTSTTSRASTTAVSDDPHLLLTLQPNATYFVHYTLFVSGHDAGDARYKLRAPTGATATYSVWGPGTTTWGAVTGEGKVSCSPSISGFGELTLGTTSITVPLRHNLFGIVVNSSQAGTLALQWAQFASQVNGTELRAGSYVIARRLDIP